MRFTIKAKLIGGFATMLILLAVGSFLALDRLGGMNDRITSIVDVSAEKVKLGARINQDLIAISRAEKNMILATTQEEMDGYADFIDTARTEMQTRRQQLRDLVDDSGKAQLDQFAAEWDKYLAVHDNVRELTRENSNSKAKQLSFNAAREAYDAAEAALIAIVDKNDREADQAQNLAVLRRIVEKIKLSARIRANLLEIQRGEKNMILATTQTQMTEYEDAINKAKNSLEERLTALEGLVTGTGAVELAQFKQYYTDYMNYHEQVKTLTEQNSNNRAFDLASGDGRELADAAEALMTKIVAKNDQDMVTDKQMSDQNYAMARNILIIILAVSMLIGITVALWISISVNKGISSAITTTKVIADGDLSKDVEINTDDEIGDLLQNMKTMTEKLRSIVFDVKQATGNVNVSSNQMSSASQQVASGANEMSATAQQLSQGSTEQAASVEEVSSSMEQMASNIKQNTDNAITTEKIAQKAANDAEEGGKAVSDTVTAMNEIAEKITIIEDIARETNMLSLNAAIEAARAGEHGKGFAVVAAQVRKLAENSQKAAGEISNLSSSSVEVAERAGELLDQIVPDIQKTASLVQEISAASREQNSGAEQINKAIMQLDNVIQQNASASEQVASTAEEQSSQSEEMAATSEELASQASQLQDTISFFKLNENESKRQLAAPVQQLVHAGGNGGTKAVATNGGVASKPTPKPAASQQNQKTKKPVTQNVNAGGGQNDEETGITLSLSESKQDELDSSFEEF
jgi:methyl-accepting chemotaxis protein